jgi:hypothetical protein
MGSRRAAFREAKRDAKIPTTADPIEVKHIPLTKTGANGVGRQTVLDAEGKAVYTREYHYQNMDDERVVIQEHSWGHQDYPSNHASHRPHFNVREHDPDTGNGHRNKTLHLKSVSGHYVFE